MGFDLPYFASQLFCPSPAFLAGLGVTLGVGIAAELLGFALALALVQARLCRCRPLRAAAATYVWVLRGTPLLVQIVFLYTGLAAAGLCRFSDISVAGLTLPGNLQAAVVALALHEAAYLTEILRAGIQAVPPGQVEAARALGMRGFTIRRRIELPQALRAMLPALGNQLSAVLKNTTLVSVIGVSEMLLATETLNAITFRTFELYTILALYFLLIAGACSIMQHAVEQNWRRI